MFTPHLIILLFVALFPFTLAQVEPRGLECNPQATQRPGMCQPRPPGYQPPIPWPQLDIPQPPPELASLEVATNGYIRAAHALLLADPDGLGQSGMLGLVQQVARQVLLAHPDLAWLDLSLYRRQGYGGAGGAPPLLTVSLPAGEVDRFAQANLVEAWVYPRLWFNPGWAAAAEPVPLASPSPVEWGLPVTRTRVPEEYLLRRFDLDQRKAALTFDDAFHPLYAPLLLDLLRRNRARATFFVVGRNAQAYPFYVRDALKQGHELANHTFHHLRPGELTDFDLRNEILNTNRLIEQLTGRPAKYFRPPGGAIDARVVGMAHSLGQTTALWTLNPNDTANPGVETVLQRLRSGMKPGAILLLHENAPDTLGALNGFLRWALSEGWELTSLSALNTRR